MTQLIDEEPTVKRNRIHARAIGSTGEAPDGHMDVASTREELHLLTHETETRNRAKLPSKKERNGAKYRPGKTGILVPARNRAYKPKY
jgi:hypothetical protein